MKFTPNLPRSTTHHRSLSGFTLTELALCIAVVGIALVAIIGVLPSGLMVQKQNREDTLITEDAKFLMEAIRSGSTGIADLTNYVEEVRWIVQFPNGQMRTNLFQGPLHPNRLPNSRVLWNTEELIGLLSLPREQSLVAGIPLPSQLRTNRVQAIFRSFGSAFTDKPYREMSSMTPSPTRLDGAFRYMVTCESRPVATRPPFLTQSGGGGNLQEQILLESSLHEVVLTFQWPVYRVGNDYRVGNSRHVFRSQLHAGREIIIPNYLGSGASLSRFVPGAGGTLPRRLN